MNNLIFLAFFVPALLLVFSLIFVVDLWADAKATAWRCFVLMGLYMINSLMVMCGFIAIAKQIGII